MHFETVERESIRYNWSSHLEAGRQTAVQSDQNAPVIKNRTNQNQLSKLKSGFQLKNTKANPVETKKQRKAKPLPTFSSVNREQFQPTAIRSNRKIQVSRLVEIKEALATK